MSCIEVGHVDQPKKLAPNEVFVAFQELFPLGF